MSKANQLQLVLMKSWVGWCSYSLLVLLVVSLSLLSQVSAQNEPVTSFPELLEWNESVASVVWSPDGEKIAMGSNEIPYEINIWRYEDFELLHTLSGSEQRINSIEWSPDGSRIASIDWGHVRIWDALSGQEMTIIDTIATSVSWSPDGSRFATSEVGINIWDAATGQHLDFLNIPEEEQPESDIVWWISRVEYSPDGTRLASAKPDGRIWNLNDGTSTVMTKCFHYGGYLAAWSPDGNRIASHDGICNPHTGEQEVAFRFAAALVWSPDGRNIAGTNANLVTILDANSGGVVGTLEGIENNVVSLTWSPDGTIITSVEAGGTLRLWDVSLNQNSQN